MVLLCVEVGDGDGVKEKRCPVAVKTCPVTAGMDDFRVGMD